MNANYSSSPGVSMSLWDDSDTPTEIYHLYLLIQENDMQLKKKKKVTRKEKQLNQIMKEKLYRIEKDTNFLNCPLQELSQEAH